MHLRQRPSSMVLRRRTSHDSQRQGSSDSVCAPSRDEWEFSKYSLFGCIQSSSHMNHRHRKPESHRLPVPFSVSTTAFWEHIYCCSTLKHSCFSAFVVYTALHLIDFLPFPLSIRQAAIMQLCCSVVGKQVMWPGLLWRWSSFAAHLQMRAWGKSPYSSLVKTAGCAACRCWTQIWFCPGGVMLC